jgi:urease beta subunit
MNGKIGEYILKDTPITINANKKFCELEVKNTGQRVIQIGSHFHFFEVNKDLLFDRSKAYGMHLDIPSGTSTRFLPGETKIVSLTEYGGNKKIYGFGGLVNGKLSDDIIRIKAFDKALESGYIRRDQL